MVISMAQIVKLHILSRKHKHRVLLLYSFLFVFSSIRLFLQFEHPSLHRSLSEILVCSTDYLDKQRPVKKDRSANQPVALPLLLWEKSGIERRICSPPEGIPERCCLGSHVAGGRILSQPWECQGLDRYDTAAQYTMDYLEQRPVPSFHFNGDGLFDKEPKQECDICRIMDYLLEKNWRLTFQGDSMTLQTFVGLECELLRRNYHVIRRIEKWAVRSNETNRQLSIASKMTLIVSNPEEYSTGPNRTNNAQILFYRLSRPPESSIEIREIVENSDVLVFDHGSRYHNRDEFGTAMVNLLQAYRYDSARSHNLKLLAWRQTSAQHSGLPDGHWTRTTSFEKSGCTPLLGDEDGYHLDSMRQAALLNNFSFLNAFDPDFSSESAFRSYSSHRDELIFLPYRDYTKALHYLHPGECTHYCSTPYLWLPIWRSLRLALDREVMLQEEENQLDVRTQRSAAPG